MFSSKSRSAVLVATRAWLPGKHGRKLAPLARWEFIVYEQASQLLKRNLPRAAVYDVLTLLEIGVESRGNQFAAHWV